MSSENSLVVGVIESKGWELPGAAGASRLRPGDVIVRIGPEDAKDTLEWPFPGGVQAVNKELKKYAKEGVVELRVERLMDEVDVVAELKTSKIQGKTTLANAILQENTQKNWLALAKESERQLKGSNKGGGNGVRLSASSELEDFRIRTDSIASPIEAEDLGPGSLPMTMYSIVVMPRRVKMMDLVDVHDTTDRAMAWFASSQKSGVPITLTNVQTEIIPLPNQKEEQYAEGLVNMGSYQVAIPLKYKDHRTVPEDITIMRAVRLWYAPVAEMQVEMQIDPGAKMGMAFSRTKEGFVFVNTVWPGSAAERAGVLKLFALAKDSGKRLVVMRVDGARLCPVLLDMDGSLRCASVGDLDRKMSLSAMAARIVRMGLALA
jgi:hypothetical protein